MKNNIWYNCPISNANSVILQTWDVGVHYYTGLDIICSKVYSICDGVVIQSGMDTMTTHFCIIQYSSTQCVRYSNLNNLYIRSGQILDEGEHVGDCKDYLHFEYLVTEHDNVIFPIRVGTQTYFKVDPQCIVDGSIVLSGTGLKDVTIIDDGTDIDHLVITESMNTEFGDNRGEGE